MVKKGLNKKSIIIVIFVLIALAVLYYSGVFDSSPKNTVIVENPMKSIVLENTNAEGKINIDNVVDQGVLEFDHDHINFILLSIGAQNLHKSLVGYGNPKVKLVVDGEPWIAEIRDGALVTGKGSVDDVDLTLSTSKVEVIRALLSGDIKNHLAGSIRSGNVGIEVNGDKVGLVSKGYLSMYKELTGNEEAPV